jgi:branched-chain amino acid transport system substrate-binding protein
VGRQTVGALRSARGRRLAGLVVLAGWVTTILAGCAATGRPTAPTSTGGPTTRGPKVVVRIGYLGDLTGGGTAVSRAVLDGERLAVQQYEADQPARNVIIVTASTKGTTAGAAVAARRLVADHVVAVIGPQSTTEAEGSGPVLAAAGLPALSPTVTVTTSSSTTWPGFLRIVADDQQQGTAEADEMVDVLTRRQVAVVSGPTPDDRSRVAAAAAEVAVDGATVSVSTSLAAALSVGSNGALTAASQVVASGADGVFISAAPDSARALVAALEVAGFTGSILLAADVTTSTRVLDRLGASVDGALVASPANDTSAQAVNGGAALQFRDTFRAAFGQLPPPWAAESFDASQFVLAGITAGSDTSPLLMIYLGANTWTGVGSTIQFAADGTQLHPEVWVSQIKNGDLTQIGKAS